MRVPPEYAWIEFIIMGAVLVFVIDLVGNVLYFRGRVVNALITALVFAVTFSFFLYFRFGSVTLNEWGVMVQHAH
jgi:ATP/ADP translocase